MNFLAWLIIACEVGFWIVIGLGLVTRYIFKRHKLGLFFLALTPIIDLILLITASIDLYNGAKASLIHGIAAIYIGVSIAFGKSMIKWADHRFQYYLMKQGPKPEKSYGMNYARQYMKGWGRHVLAYLIGAGLLAAVIFIIDDPSRTDAFDGILKAWSLVLGIDLLISISNFIWPTKAKEKAKI